MGCDVVVALGRATVDGVTLFGQNTDQPARRFQVLCRTPARAHAADEKIRTYSWELPEARQTAAVLGNHPGGAWGYTHGVNEHGLAVGCSRLRNKLPCREGSFLGTDLVRLALERCRSATAAVDFLTGFVERHGQRVWADTSPDSASDNAFVVADADEAFVVETAGHYWVCQAILEVRAVSDLSSIRQDWDRIARGLSEQVLSRGWWPADGSKLDFADAVGHSPVRDDFAHRRWGRAMLLLEQQNGQLDIACMRRLLSDHYEGTDFEVDPLAQLHGPVPLCSHGHNLSGRATAASFVTALTRRSDRLPVSWCAFGPPCLTAYLPVFVDGELPPALTDAARSEGRGLWQRVQRLADHLYQSPQEWAGLRDDFARLQAVYDQEAAEFASEGAALRARGATAEVERLAGLYMQHAIEQFEAVLDQHGAKAARRTMANGRSSEMALYRL